MTNQNQKSWIQKAVMLFEVEVLGSWRTLNGVRAEGHSKWSLFLQELP